MKRILFISATRIGDAVLSTGPLAELSQRHPDALFTVACGPAAAPLFRAHPQLEQLIVLRKQPYAGHWRSLWWRTAATRWHMVVDLRRSLMPWLLWAKNRTVPPKGSSHEHRLITLGRAINGQKTQQPTVWLTASDHARAMDLVDPDQPILALAPTANWAAKVWPADKFAQLAHQLTQTDGAPLAGAQVFITGGPSEESQAQPVLDAVPPDRRIAAVGLDLPTTAAVFARCDLFIGNDSGLMHLAGAVGAPTIGLFGPSDDRLYAPQGPNCRVVRTPETFWELVGAPGFDHKTADTQMGNLEVRDVKQAALDLLAQTAKRTLDKSPAPDAGNLPFTAT